MRRLLAPALLLVVAPLTAQVQDRATSGPWFRAIGEQWQLVFDHQHGGTGERYMVETMVGGVVLFDYDGDGDDDAFFVDGGQVGDDVPADQRMVGRSRLLRNDLAAGSDGSGGAPRFVDVTDQAGITFAGYGCGATAGDVDGDGDVDLYLTAWGRNALFLNRGDGSFEEVATSVGVADPEWSASAAFADTDRDGDLDLYVANYVEWAPETREFCGNRETGVRGYCHPGVYQGSLNRFYRNRGDGTFEDASAASGLTGPTGSSLGVVFGDFNDDGWDDLYVANDLDPNELYLSDGAGGFEDATLLSGTAASPNGHPEAGMGVEAVDLNGDLRPDLVVTNFALETNALYRNAGAGVFIDRRFADNLAEPTLRALGFGVVALDAEHDGDLDLVFANGHILDNLEELGQDNTHEQGNQLLLNERGRFVEATDTGLDLVRVSRGMAAADLDLDGDQDLVVVNSNQRSEVYAGLAADSGSRWLRVDLERTGSAGNRFAIGARSVLAAGGTRQLRERRTASSYLSQNGLGLHFAWREGAGEEKAQLSVRWPEAGGGQLRLNSPGSGRRLLIRH